MLERASQIQTKFTRPEAQDPDACPYDMTATLEEQVHVSIQTSLRHLSHHRVDDPINDDSIYLDALLLHSPFPIEKFEDTLTVWRTMSLYVPHKIRALGVANISPEHLVRLYDAVDVKPSYVQNRFHEQTKWEITQRKFCKDHGIIFQAHKVLKSKDDILASSLIGEVSAVLGVTGEVALYLLVLGLGDYMTILNGTRNEIHMQEDLESLRRFETWATKPENQLQWQSHMACFKEFLHED